MLKKILIGLAMIVVVFLIVVAMQPSEYHVTRSISISAVPAVVFAQVDELKKWEAWSPWLKMDPAMKLTYSGPAAGVGASSGWAGNSEVGEGRMTITESRPRELVRFHLEFVKPMAGTSAAEFTFKPEGNQTVVTWSMTGKNGFIAKAICLFMNMDKMVGGQFDQGLASMKTVAESAGKK